MKSRICPAVLATVPVVQDEVLLEHGANVLDLLELRAVRADVGGALLEHL